MDTTVIKLALKNWLNDNIVDPFPTRRGDQFFIESDGFNFNRLDTFPKGMVVDGTESQSRSGFGKTGIAREEVEFDIYYYCKEKDKYTSIGSVTYNNQDLVKYILRDIREKLYRNPFIGSDWHINQDGIGDIEPIGVTTEGTTKFYYSVIPVTFYGAYNY